MKASNLTRVALLLTLLILAAQLSIPIGPVAISLQTLIVLVIGLLLPTKQAVLTTILYLMVGLMGLPIFTQAMGGPHAVFLPSFGFILSFPPAVWIMSKIRQLQSKKIGNNYLLAVILGHFTIYIIGVSYMTFIFLFYLEKKITFGKILWIGMLPFIPGDIIKSLLAINLAKRLNRYMDFH